MTITDMQAILAKHLFGQRHPQYFGTNPTYEENSGPRGKPRPYLLAAIAIAKGMGLKNVVEIGSMRQPMNHSMEEFNPACCNDGHSTMFWAHSGLDVHTVDIDPRNTAIVRQSTQGLSNVHAYTGDGIEFLGNFESLIEVLYLDAWDAEPGEPFAENHLRAYEAAWMTDTSLIVIDDTDVAFGGKGRLVIPRAIRDGYELLVMGRQTMLVRGDE